MLHLRYFAPVAALLFSWSASPAGAPALEDLVGRPDFRAPRISPDGKYLAVVVGQKDRDVLRMIAVGSMQVSAEMSVDGEPDVLGYAWAADNRIVASFGRRSTTSDDRSEIGGNIFAMNVDRSSSTYLFGSRPGYLFASDYEIRTGESSGGAGQIIDGLPDDPEHVLVAVYRLHGFRARSVSSQVFKVNTYSGERVEDMQVPEGTFYFLSDGSGRVRVASGIDEHSDAVVYFRAPGDLGFARLEILSGPGRRFHPAAYDEAQSAVYLPWDIDANTTGIVKYTTASKEIEPIGEGREFDVYEAIANWQGTNIIASTHYSDKRHYVYHDPLHRLPRLLASIQDQFPNDDAVVESFSRDERLAVIAVGSAGNPEDYFLADLESMHVQHLFSARASINPDSLGDAEHFEFDSRDGTILRGFVIFPPGAARSGLPLVVLPYGKMLSSRHYNWFDADAQIFASRGYAVLLVNHRGSTGYGSAFEKAGFRRWGTVVQDDVANAVRWTIDQDIADPHRVCIAGRFFGAYVALMSATREPELYACAVAHNGIYDLPRQFGADRLPNVGMLRNYIATIVGTDDEELARQSPVRGVNDIRADLLITYSRYRRHSPPEQSKALMKALDRAGIDYERYAVQEEPDGIVDDATREAHYRRILEFVDAHLAAAAAEPAPVP